MSSIQVFLDTDIGDDIDDAYALALILASPELELRGVSTVFKNTTARARQARTLLKVSGTIDVPVAAGCGGVMSPRIDYGAGTVDVEGRHMLPPFADAIAGVKPKQDPSSFPESELPAQDERSGVQLLIDTILGSDGEVIPITIGAMTNMAVALVSEPRIIPKIPRIVAMAGCFSEDRAEWNIRCDPTAAAVVCGSGVPVTFVGLDVTLRCMFSHSDLNRLFETDGAVASHLSAATREWRKHAMSTWKHGMPVLHDPLAVETLIDPNLVETTDGTVTVDLCSRDGYARTRLTAGSGPHRVCTGVRHRDAVDLWLDRVCG